MSLARSAYRRPLLLGLAAILALTADSVTTEAEDSGTPLRVPHRGTVLAFAFAPDGSTFALGCFDEGVGGPPKPHPIELRRTGDGQRLLTFDGAQAWPASFAFSPDGRMLATIGWKQRVGSLKLWDVANGRVSRSFDFQTLVGAVAFAPDGRTLAATSGNDVRLYRVEDGRLLHQLKGHELGIHSLAFSPDGRTLASGAADNTLRLWNVADGSGRRVMRGDGAAADEIFEALAFSPDGRTLASSSRHAVGESRATKIWGVDDGSMRWSRPGGAPIGFSRNVQTIIVTTDSGFQLLRAEDGRTTSSLRLPAGSKRRIHLSGDGMHFALTDGPSLLVGRVGDLTP